MKIGFPKNGSIGFFGLEVVSKVKGCMEFGGSIPVKDPTSRADSKKEIGGFGFITGP